MVEIINQRAKTLLNPRSRKTWSKKRQNAFDQAIRWFDQASPEDRERFENDSKSSTPKRKP